MRIDRRYVLIGIVLVVCSVTMATQFATTKAGYTYGIVHPSNANIRFVACDDGPDALRVLRVANNASGSQFVTLSLGSFSPNSLQTYTAAFAIVNEEEFPVTITHMNLSGTGGGCISVWLHGNRTIDAGSEAATAVVKLIEDGASLTTAETNAWVLAAGDGDAAGMNQSAILTPWDETAHVRYNDDTTFYGQNETYDWIWVQITLDIPSDGTPIDADGLLWIHFRAA